MKYTLCTLCCFTGIIAGIYGQRSVNHFSVSNSLEEVFYVGINNPFELLTDTLDGYKVNVKCNNGSISYLPDKKEFNIIPQRSGRTTVEVFVSDSMLYAKQDFLVYSLPEPELYLGGSLINDIKYLTFDLLSKNKFNLYFNGDIQNTDEWIKIRGYTIGYQRRGLYITFYNEGTEMNERSKVSLGKLKSGMTISIKVNIESEGNVIRSIPVVKKKFY